MRLAALEEVLFDEFPSDEASVTKYVYSIILSFFFSIKLFLQMVKYCIFTKPKFPDRDYTKYAQSVVYCGNETTLSVMTCFNVNKFKID